MNHQKLEKQDRKRKSNTKNWPFYQQVNTGKNNLELQQRGLFSALARSK